MIKQPVWDEYEVALLIETFWKIHRKEVERKPALQQLSTVLRKMAVSRGIQIDEFYRNFNGVSLMLASIANEFLLTDKTRHRSALFHKMTAMYNDDIDSFNAILSKAHQMIAVPSFVESDLPERQFNVTVAVQELIDYMHSCGVVILCDAPSILFVAYKSKFKRTNDEMAQIKEAFARKVEEQKITFAVGACRQKQNVPKNEVVNADKGQDIKTEIETIHTEDVFVDVTSISNADEGALSPKSEFILENRSIDDFESPKHQILTTSISSAGATFVLGKENVSLDNIPFDQITVTMLDISVRALHTLQKLGIVFLKDLYDADFQSVRSCGQKTIAELESIKEKYANRLIEDVVVDLPYSDQNKAKLINYIYKKLNLHNDLVFEDSSDWVKRDYYFNLVDLSIELLGEEMCALAIEQPQVCSGFFFALDGLVGDAKKNLERISDIRRNITTVPKKQLECSIYPLLRFYQKYVGDIADSTIETISNGYHFVKDLKTIREIGEEDYLQIKPFLVWLHFDIIKLTSDFIDKSLNVKKYVACTIAKRASGMTLEAIAKDENLTRERIRQMERRGLDKANQIYSQYRLVELISALCNDDRILREEEIKDFFGDKVSSEILIYLLANIRSNDFVYDRHLKLFNLRMELHYSRIFVEQKVRNLPELILDNDWNNAIESLSHNIDVDYEYLQQVALTIYSNYGKYYARRRLPLIGMYEYIIKKYYPTGIKLYTEETNHFRNLIKQEFGEDVNLPSQNRAIDAAIPRVSVLCDRGTYIHKSFIRLDKTLISQIDCYLEQTSRTAISYAELFRVFQDELLLKTSVTNRFYLQGVLKLELGNKYYFFKDLVSKRREVTLDNEIDEFVRARGHVSRKEIMNEFEGLQESAICQMIMRCPNILGINNAEYIHASTLNICDNDYSISEIISNIIHDVPLSSRKLLDILYVEKEDFLERNNITTHTKLFAVMKYMFGDEFSFSSPYIAQKGSKNITNTDVLLSLLEDYSEITIDELLSIVEENQLRYLSTNSMVESLNDAFIRVNEEVLISVDMLRLDDEDIAKINEYVDEKVHAQSFVALKTFDDWIWLPNIGAEWNPYLLRSILQKYNDLIVFIDYPHSDSQTMATILVDADLGIDDYLSLIKYAVQKENAMSEFVSFKEFYDWISEEGLIGNDIPAIITNNFLEILPTNGLKLIKNR